MWCAVATAGGYGEASPRVQRQVRDEIAMVFGPNASCAILIARRESGLTPWAVNWSDRHANGPGSFGVFQIGRVHVGMVGGDWRRLLDWRVNIRVAHRLFRRAGWAPWRGCRS
jgi:hypothetical protein